MPFQFACRADGCQGVVRGNSSDDQFVCSECGRSYRKKAAQRQPARQAGATAELDEFGDLEGFDDLSTEPIRPKRKPAAQKPGKSKKKKSSVWPAIGGFLHANRFLLLTRVLPAVLVLITLIVVVAGFARRQETAAKKEALATELSSKIRNISPRSENHPYVRGRVVILDIGKPGESDYHINSHFEVPEDSASIGSVIAVKWSMRQDPYRSKGGAPLYMKNSSDPVALNHWNCRISLIDLKRKVVVYQTSLRAPEKYGEIGEVVIVTPMTIVPASETAKVFDEIKGFRTIGLDDDPPAK